MTNADAWSCITDAASGLRLFGNDEMARLVMQDARRVGPDGDLRELLMVMVDAMDALEAEALDLD